MSTSNTKIRIAILGGGLAGAAVYRGLIKHAHLQVDIFESAQAFREAGQGIGFNQNAVWAMEKLGLRHCLDDSGAVRMGGVRYMMGDGPQSGDEIIRFRDLRPRGTWITQRTSFLFELLKDVDQSALHAGKKLETLVQGPDGIELKFKDGSSHVCDILIGADGIHSTVRKHVIGHEHEAADPVFAGWWIVWTLKPFGEAVRYLDTRYVDPEDPCQYGWCGQNGFIMHDLLANNSLVQCAVAIRAPEDSLTDPSQWSRTTTRAELAAHFETWTPKLSKGMIELITDDTEPTPQMSLWHHKPAPTYVNGGITIVGDAADATTPWQGSGGGMALEDALSLSELLGRAQTVAEAKVAIGAYDSVNRPRRQRLVRGSYDSGLTMCGSFPGVGLDKRRIHEKFEFNWDWIIDADLDARVAEAVGVMQERLKR